MIAIFEVSFESLNQTKFLKFILRFKPKLKLLRFIRRLRPKKILRYILKFKPKQITVVILSFKPKQIFEIYFEVKPKQKIEQSCLIFIILLFFFIIIVLSSFFLCQSIASQPLAVASPDWLHESGQRLTRPSGRRCALESGQAFVARFIIENI